MTTNRSQCHSRGSSLLSIALTVALAVLLQMIGLPVANAGPLPPGVTAQDAKQFMPVSEVKRGMRGYGLTVFHGTKIEKFDVEILGVLKQMNTGKDLILVRCGGGPITTRNTGIIAGMSGSPIYVSGKLVGAISYGSGFAKEPVGMVTPIADMLEAWDSALPSRPSGHSSIELAQPVNVSGKSVQRIEIGDHGSARSVSDGTLRMEPLMTPLMVSGVSRRGLTQLADILRPYGVEPMAGPGGSKGDPSIKATLQPGAAMGVSLARGDIDISAIGTLTYRNGSQIVGFGHPLIGIGAIDAPLTTAFVDDVLSSYQTSTKMATPLKTVGRIFQDRPWSVAGTVGPLPKTIPATVTVDDAAFGRKRTFKVEVINHPLLASRILTMVVGEAIYDTHPAPGDSTAEVSYEISADQIGKIKRSNVFFDSTSIETTAISDIGSLLQLLSGNKFYPLDIKSVNVQVRIAGKRDTATIDRIFVKKSEFEPGETIDVGVVLRPYKQERVTKTFSVKIPATAADGKMTLAVRGGGQPAAMPVIISSTSSGEDAGTPVPILPGSSSLAAADNVKQLIDKYLEREKNNEVVVQFVMPSTAVNVAGEKLTGLPSAIADVMKSSRNSGLRMEREEVKQAFPVDSIVFGSAQLQISVKRKDMKEAKSPPKLSAAAMDVSGAEIEMMSGLSLDMDDSEYAVPHGMGEGPGDFRQPVDSLLGPDEDGNGISDDKEEPPAKETSEKGAPKDKTPSEPTGPTDRSAPKTDAKTVVRQAKTWSQRTQADFARGTFSGVSASSENKLELAPTLQKLVETSEQFVWCLAPAADGVYAGTGNSGKVVHITEDGEVKTFFETGELEVHSLAIDSKGNLYAGTSPHGKVFRVTPDGKGEVVFTTKEKYALALALDGEGNLYAGVGDAGRIYRVTPGGSGELFAEINEQQVLSLYWDPKGSLVAGTGTNGVVYRIDKSGKASPIFDAAEDSVTSVVTDSLGNVYAGTSPKGSVYRIEPDGRSKAVYTKATRVMSMVCDSRNRVYAVSDGTLVEITPDDTVIQLDSSKDKVQFLSLALDERTGTLYAGTGNIGSVYVSKCCDVTGQFESAVHDTGMISRWGRAKWTAITPEGTKVELQTRTGNVAAPDSTWSNWSAPYTSASGEQITGEPARYIQYRVTLKANAGVSPKVSGVTISYLTPNQKPTVKLTAPVGGEAWAGKETIRWTGSDPDNDKLTYDVYYSKDGKDWKALAGGVSASATPEPEAKKTDEEISKKIKAELDKATDVPEDMKKQVLKEMPKNGAPEPPASPAEAASSKTSHSWDTTKVEDGTYILKIVASDRTSNARDTLSSEVISEPITVCNTAPKISLRAKTATLDSAGTATIQGSASSKLLEVVGVQYRIDGGAWLAAVTDDGMYDSSSEEFTVTTDKLAVGPHKIEVQAIDAAGNAASETVEIK